MIVMADRILLRIVSIPSLLASEVCNAPLDVLRQLYVCIRRAILENPLA